MTDNVVPFRKPDPPPPGEDPLYFVTLYPKATIISQPDGEDPEPVVTGEALFDSTFHVLCDSEQAHALIAITDGRNLTYRQKDSFETPAQHAWLARRLDDVYKDFTGSTRTESRVRAFFSRLNPFRKGR